MQLRKFTFPIRGRSFNFARLFRICETAPQHFNVFATSSSLSRYSSSVSGKDLWTRCVDVNRYILQVEEYVEINANQENFIAMNLNW